MCENVLFLRALNFFNITMQILRFVVPILLIIKLILDIYKQIINVKDENVKEKIGKRIIACVIIFLIPSIINIFLGFLENITGSKFNYSECNANIKNINYYIEKRDLEEKLEYEKSNQENIKKYNELMKKIDKNVKENLTKLSEKKNQSSEDKKISTTVGKKYNLSDSQITDIAKVCQREQGRPAGAAAEAELMINKYVLSGYSGSLYDYLFKSSARNWWAPIKSGRYKRTTLKPEIKEAVRKVINEGQRTMPAYINEHDCISCGDVMYIKTDGKSANKNKRSDFVQDKTFVYTVYKKNSRVKYWIFYKFPDEKSDPFGYTVDAKSKLEQVSK